MVGERRHVGNFRITHGDIGERRVDAHVLGLPGRDRDGGGARAHAQRNQALLRVARSVRCKHRGRAGERDERKSCEGPTPLIPPTCVGSPLPAHSV
jgi:hypothetical protein